MFDAVSKLAYTSFITLKGGRHAKKVFLIHASNGLLNGKIMKYTFLKVFLFHDLTIKQAVESASGYWYKRLTPLHLTSQVEWYNTEEMGKAQFYASFVSSIASRYPFTRLVIQGHHDDTLPDRSKCYKNNCGRQ